MTDPKPAPCTHENFQATVEVNRLEDTGRFAADIKIQCAQCNEPFRFLGVNPGLSPYEPKCSVTGTELHAPIEPEGTPKLFSGAQFVMPPMPLKEES